MKIFTMKLFLNVLIVLFTSFALAQDSDRNKDSFELATEIKHSAFSNDGKHLFTASNNGNVIQWDAKTGNKIEEFKIHDRVVSIDISANGTLATGGTERVAKVWNPETAKIIASFDKTGDIFSIAISEPGRLVAVGGRKYIHVWNVESGEKISILSGHTNQVRALDFSDDERYLVSGSYDKSVRVWDLKTGNTVQMFSGHANGERTTGRVLSVECCNVTRRTANCEWWRRPDY